MLVRQTVMAARTRNALTEFLSHRMFDRVLRIGEQRALRAVAAHMGVNMADTFEMTPEHLAKSIANGARRARAQAAKVAEDAADVALGKGQMEIAQALTIVAAQIRGNDPAEPIVAAVEEEPELPEVQHMDDFEQGAAIVRSGADRRLVTGYNGASGHLRD